MPSMAGRAKGFAFAGRSEERTSELQSHSEISYAVFCLKKKKVQSRQSVTRRGGPSMVGVVEAECQGQQVEPGIAQGNGIGERIALFVFFNETAPTETYTLSYTLSLHDALPISYTGALGFEPVDLEAADLAALCASC